MIHIPIIPGFRLGEELPACFWAGGELYRILYVIKTWREDWRNTFYRVITDSGEFDIYRHKKLLPSSGPPQYTWWLERRIDSRTSSRSRDLARGYRNMTSQGESFILQAY